MAGFRACSSKNASGLGSFLARFDVWRHQGRHSPSFKCGRTFQLAMSGKLFQNGGHDPPAFLLVLHFPSSKEHSHLHFVVVAQEFQRICCLRFDVVIARFRPNPNLLDLLLTRLGALLVFVRAIEAHFAVIEDAAHRRAIVRCDFDKVEVGRPGLLECLGSWHDAKLLSVYTN